MRRNRLIDWLADARPETRTIVARPPVRPSPAGPPPRVTVVVPCYNYGHFLDACVSSLIAQERVDVDVLIIDDASPDGSGMVAAAIAEQDPRVRVVQHEQNRGHLATYNEGLDRAEGEYVVLLDADDLLTPGALARATALLQAHPEVGLVYGHPRNFTGPTPADPDLRLRSWSIWDGSDWIAAQIHRGLSIVYSPEVVMRASVRRAVGGFRAGLDHAADLEMWLRFAAVSAIGRVNGPDQALRRLHSASMMTTGYNTVLLDLEGRQEAYESFFARDADTLPQRDQLLRSCRRVTADEALTFVNHRLTKDEIPSGPELKPYLDLVNRLEPDLTRLRGWREYELRTIGGKGLAPRFRTHLQATRRAVVGRYAWHRWRWAGY